MSYDKKFQPPCTLAEAAQVINEFAGRAFMLYTAAKELAKDAEIFGPKHPEEQKLADFHLRNLKSAVDECAKFYNS